MSNLLAFRQDLGQALGSQHIPTYITEFFQWSVCSRSDRISARHLVPSTFLHILRNYSSGQSTVHKQDFGQALKLIPSKFLHILRNYPVNSLLVLRQDLGALGTLHLPTYSTELFHWANLLLLRRDPILIVILYVCVAMGGILITKFIHYC